MITVVASHAEAPGIAAEVPDSAVVDPTDAGRLPTAPAVIWLDGLSVAEIAVLDALLVSRGRADIAVSSTRFDGLTDPPLVAHCRGLIAGFGYAGLRAAAQLIERVATA